MEFLMRTLKVGLFALVGSLAWASSASAGTVLCSSLNVDVTNRVTNTAGCQYSTLHDNDPASAPVEVNVDAFFGFTDWQLAQQGINQNALSGSWNVTGFANYTNYQWLIIFKDGSAFNLIGYINAAGQFAGTWQTPFVANLLGPGVPDGNDHAVSHISYYFRTSTQPCTVNCEPLITPEPGTLLMFGTGLALLAARLRRRKA
jgi:hypothetical protein